jgi:hypothetical protein
MSHEDLRYYYKVVKTIKGKCGCKYPINIRRMKLSSTLCGDCSFDKDNKKFHIRINKNQSIAASIDTIFHEISHCLSWDKDKDDHGEQWGIAYSKIYRIYEKYIHN